MEPNEYTTMYHIEDDYWWYVGLRALVIDFLKKYIGWGPKLRLLDAGCGTGGFLARADGYRCFGFDLSPLAIDYCRRRGLERLFQASVREIPFLDESCDIIVSLDVLCNVPRASDMAVLKEFYRVLRPGGILVLNLPAYDTLKSRHDKAVHIQHRYGRKELHRKLEAAGFWVETISYRNSLLFPEIAALRLLERLWPEAQSQAKSDLVPLPRPVNGFLSSLLAFENRLILSGLRFPFGLSLLCSSRKPAS